MKECFCIVIHMEGRRSDPADKNSAIERLNQFYILRYYYPEGAEMVRASENKNLWVVEFERCIPIMRSRACFAEYCVNSSQDSIPTTMETLKEHVAAMLKSTRKPLIDLDAPFVIKANFPYDLADEVDPELDIWL